MDERSQHSKNSILLEENLNVPPHLVERPIYEYLDTGRWLDDKFDEHFKTVIKKRLI